MEVGETSDGDCTVFFTLLFQITPAFASTDKSGHEEGGDGGGRGRTGVSSLLAFLSALFPWAWTRTETNMLLIFSYIYSFEPISFFKYFIFDIDTLGTQFSFFLSLFHHSVRMYFHSDGGKRREGQVKLSPRDESYGVSVLCDCDVTRGSSFYVLGSSLGR